MQYHMTNHQFSISSDGYGIGDDYSMSYLSYPIYFWLFDVKATLPFLLLLLHFSEFTFILCLFSTAFFIVLSWRKIPLPMLIRWIGRIIRNFTASRQTRNVLSVR